MELHLNNELLNYKQTETEILSGKQYIFKFDNGFGASVVRHEYSLGNGWELAVLDKCDKIKIYYCELTDGDILCGLSDDDVELALKCIKNSLLGIYFEDIKEVVQKLSI